MKSDSAKIAVPKSLLELPWWSMVSATVAFTVWALALPGVPVFPAYDPRVAGALVIAVVFVLAQLDPYFSRRSPGAVPAPAK